MSTPIILTAIAPALILLFVFVIVRFFPPSLNRGFILEAPQWWSRDQATWDKGHSLLAQKYLIYGILLLLFCLAALFLEWTFGATIGYVLLIAFFVLANFQVRTIMEKSVK
jgi:hypothetical protein